jgi:hypothetical protein
MLKGCAGDEFVYYMVERTADFIKMGSDFYSALEKVKDQSAPKSHLTEVMCGFKGSQFYNIYSSEREIDR